MSGWGRRLGLGLAAVLVGAYLLADTGLARLDDAERRALVDRGEAQHFAELLGGVSHYRMTGPSGGPPVLLVHGFSSSGSGWRPFADALADAGFRVLAPDLYGRGFSDRPPGPYDADLFDTQLVGLLDHLFPGQPIHVVGKSMGGAVATVFAARHPERLESLTLIAPAAFGDQGASPLVTLPLFGDWLFAVAGDRIFRSRAEDLSRNRADPEAYLKGFLRQLDYPGYPQAMLSSMRHILKTDFAPLRRSVGQGDYPVLAVWGSLDDVVPVSHAEGLAEEVPRTRLEIIEGATHAVEREHFEQVEALLREHLGGPHSGRS